MMTAAVTVVMRSAADLIVAGSVRMRADPVVVTVPDGERVFVVRGRPFLIAQHREGR